VNISDLEKELKDLRDTHKRMEDHLGVSPNYLLSNYYKLTKRALTRIKELETKEKVE
jgi:hypothetical protein